MFRGNLIPVWIGVILFSGIFLMGQDTWPPQPTCTDVDEDGYGNPADASCTYPELDCDDSDETINPGSTEVCDDDVDNDCDGDMDLDDTDCDASIYGIQQGQFPQDSEVTMTEVVVTSPITPDGGGFFVQEPLGGEWSGIFVFNSEPGDPVNVSAGDLVTITGTYTEVSGLSEISIPGGSAVTVQGSASVPAAAIVIPADIATGGTLAENYEGVLVEVNNVTVIDTNPDFPNDYGEFMVTGNLRVDDLFYDADPLPTSFVSITGPLYFSFGDFKLVPRSAADLLQ